MSEPNRRTGALLAVTACTMWGLFPAFFRLLQAVEPARILAHRAFWSGLLSVAILVGLLRPAWRAWRLHSTPAERLGHLKTLALAALLLAGNWGTYIYAVTTARVLEASLGYFICPLVTVLLGVVFLRERLRRAQKWAVLLALAGVLQLVVRAPSVPWLALILAGSFSVYGLLRKRLPLEPMLASCLEALLMAPVAAIYLAATTGTAPTFSSATTTLLVLSGAITAVPLILYALAAQRMPYSTLGMLQYITPTLQFGLAVFAYGEPVGAPQVISFALIWAGVAVSSASAFSFGVGRPALRRA